MSCMIARYAKNISKARVMRSRFNAQQTWIWVSCEAKDADIATDIGQ